jgi:hypothetical protein
MTAAEMAEGLSAMINGRSALGLAVLALLLQACADKPQATGARLFAADMTGAAKSCTVPSVTPSAGGETAVPMAVRNDRGWCAITVSNGGRPYSAGLLVNEPAHGKVFIHTVGDTTRIDYTPDARYAGADAFSVKLIPSDAVVRASVTVTQ